MAERRFAIAVTALSGLALIAACGSSTHHRAAATPTVTDTQTPTPTTTPPPNPLAQACRDAGGTVSTGSCCASAPDFPNTCRLGVCGCAPASSRTIQRCECGEGRCFDGSTCATR